MIENGIIVYSFSKKDNEILHFEYDQKVDERYLGNEIYHNLEDLISSDFYKKTKLT